MLRKFYDEEGRKFENFNFTNVEFISISLSTRNLAYERHFRKKNVEMRNSYFIEIWKIKKKRIIWDRL